MKPVQLNFFECKMSEDVVPIYKRRSLSRDAANWLGWILIIVVIVAPRIFDLNVFYARDELAIWPWADEFALAVWAGDPEATLTTSDYPGIPMFWVQTLFLTFKSGFSGLLSHTAVPLERLTQDRSLDSLAERRLAAGLFVSMQLIAVVWLVQGLFGWPVALLSAILLGLDPFSLSEARLLRLEMISALFVCLSLLLYFLYFRRRRAALLFWSGVMAGLGVSSKTSAGLIVPYIWLLLVLDFFFEVEQTWIKKFKQLIVNGLLWGAGAIVAFWAIWPAMWVKPIEAVQYIFLSGFSQAADRSVWGDEVFFWGQIVKGGDPGPFFYPVALAFRTTPLMWMGTASALILLVVLIWRRLAKRTPENGRTSLSLSYTNSRLWGWPWPAVSLSLLLVFVILIILEMTRVISKVDRFLVPVFPVLDIVSAIGLVELGGVLAEYVLCITSFMSKSSLPVLRFTLHAFLPIFILIILVLQLLITLPSHPYFFTYWNPWAGGGQAAMKVLPIGAGEGIDQAMSYLNNQPGAAEKTLVCGASEPWCSRVFKGETVRSANYFDGRWVEADYASFYISQLQRRNYPPELVDFFGHQAPLYQVELQGVNYVQVYDVPEMGHYAGRANDLAGLGRLLGYSFTTPWSTAEPTAAKPGDVVEATIWWTNLGAGVHNLVVRWIDETGYEWGRARVIPLPEYAAITQTQRAIAAGTAMVTIPLGTPPGLYFWRVGVNEPGEDNLLGEFNLPDEANKFVVNSGPILAESDRLDVSHRLDQALTPEVTLLGYDRPAQALTATVPTWLTLYWRAAAQPADYQVILKLVDGAGQEVAHWQGSPGHGHYPTKNWQAGEIVKDVWALQVPAGTVVGNYDLEIYLVSPNQSQIENQKSKIQNLEVLPQPVRYEVPAMQGKLDTQFGDHLILLGYDLFFDTGGTTPDRLTPIFYWQSQADFQGAFDLSLTLRNAGTDQVIKEWRLPVGNNGVKTFWKAGEVVGTPYRLEVGAPVQGRYDLEIALQDRTDGQIEAVRSGEGQETTFVRIENIQDRMVVRVTDQ